MLLLQEICAYYVCRWRVAVVLVVYCNIKYTTGGVINPSIYHRWCIEPFNTPPLIRRTRRGRVQNYQGRVRMDQGYNRSHSEAETGQESRRYVLAAVTGGACQLGSVTIPAV